MTKRSDMENPIAVHRPEQSIDVNAIGNEINP
jgi:hypothetical protein